MFVRVKKVGKYEYLQIVENYREGRKNKQRVVLTLGNLSQMHASGQLDRLIKSLSRFSKKAMLLTSESETESRVQIIGPSLIFERLWKETGISSLLVNLLSERKFGFDVERAIFTTVLHRIMVSGSDRSCDYWRQRYRIKGTEDLSLHQFYRAMCFLGEELADQSKAVPFAKRRVKDLIEEELFFSRRDIFSSLGMVFFDTTSLYFEGEGGDELGERGYSKDNKPHLKQMIVGVLMDETGMPLCCEMWPGNIADVTTLLPIVDSIKKRFGVHDFCIVADRGMISKTTVEFLESDDSNIKYILGVRMRLEKEVRDQVLSDKGQYITVHPLNNKKRHPSPLQVKEVFHNNKRYIVCHNEKQALKDKFDRETIVQDLEDKLKKGASSLIGNKGYRKYLTIKKKDVHINYEKLEEEARFDGKWVLRTNTDLTAQDVAFSYKELWRVERIFRNMKSLLDTRPIYHRQDETISGHVFCSFLALVLHKELRNRLENNNLDLEWVHIKEDLNALYEITVQEGDRSFILRSTCQGNCGKVFNAVGVRLPSSIREG
jgi:hypothetical protein